MKFQEIVEIIKELEGVIGTILGSVITLFATHFLKTTGKLKFYVTKFDGEYWYKDKKYHDYSTTKEKNFILNHYEFRVYVDIYNSSESLKIMRDLKVCVYYKGKIIETMEINDLATKKVTSYGFSIEKTGVYNIEGRSTCNIGLSGNLSKKTTKLFKDGLVLKIRYKDEKNKDRYFIIFDGKISE